MESIKKSKIIYRKEYENKKLLNNVFLNKKYFQIFFNPDMRKKRLDDIYFLSKFYYKNKLCEQKKEYGINEKLLKKWINAHKTEEDKKIAEMLIKPIIYVSFSEFIENLIKSVNKFNRYLKDNKIKKYYLIIGANYLGGSNFTNYLDIGKSNFWVLLIILPYLKIKPHDILLNLKQAIDFSIIEKLKNKINIVDYVFADDASYSGLQLFEHTIKDQLFEKYVYNGIFLKQDIKQIEKTNLVKIKKTSLIKTQNDSPNINLHIIVPYLSITARDISLNIQYKNNIAIHLYNNYFINNYKNYYNDEKLRKISIAFGRYGFRDTLTPLYFSHKMPDGASTINYVLLSGIISNYSDVINSQKNDDKELIKRNNDDKELIKNNGDKKFIQFINNCIYPKNKIMKPISLERVGSNQLCPISPYKNAKLFIENYLKKIV